MAAPTLLTLDEYRNRYANEKGYEYWFGEAVKKTMPTWLHALLQVWLGELFTKAGYASGSELELRIDPEWEPRPDIAAALQIEHPYPTRPIDIVAEVLSPDDKMHQVYEKCRHYERIGILQMFVLDPEARVAWEWSLASKNLERVNVLKLNNGTSIEEETIWNELDRRSRRNA